MVFELFLSIHFVLFLYCSTLLFTQSVPRFTNVGWLISIVFVPIMGSISFLTFRVRLNREGNRVLRFPEDCITNSGPSTIGERERDIQGDKLALALGYGNLEEIDNLEIIVNDDYVWSVIDGIKNAKENIHISMYLFSGKVRKMIIDELKEAQNRGVKVILLLDYRGLGNTLPWSAEFKELRSLNFVKFFGYKFTNHFNQRNHAKLVYIDGHTAWIGSHNLRDEVLLNEKNENNSLHKAQNLSIKISGKAAKQSGIFFRKVVFYNSDDILEGKEFSCDINSADNKDEINEDGTNKIYGRAIFSAITNKAGSMESLFLNLVMSCKESCIIINPYFIPSDIMLRIIQIVSERGCRVEIFCPIKWDIKGIYIIDLYLSHLNNYSNIKIYRGVGVFDHSKVLIVDNYTTCIGSYNTDWRSSFTNVELNYEIKSEKVANEIADMYRSKIGSEFVEWDVKELSFGKKFIANLQSMVATLA